MARAPWQPKQAWIVRPGKDGADMRSHGLRTRLAGEMGDYTEVVLTNCGPQSISVGEVSLWISDEQRRALIVALGGTPNQRPVS